MASEQPAGYVCDGCGRLARDPEQDMQKLREDNFLSCCPERQMLPVYTRPAPAATDTGLETEIDELELFLRRIQKTRLQAEELLAAERAEKEKANARVEFLLKQISRAADERKAIEADNAAQASRIKELTRNLEFADLHCGNEIKRVTELEAKLAAAEKSLRNIAESKDASFRIKVHALAALGGKPS